MHFCTGPSLQFWDYCSGDWVAAVAITMEATAAIAGVSVFIVFRRLRKTL